MIITDKFVYIHLHKTGGQFINQLIFNFIPGAEQIGYHYPLSMLPQKYQKLPVISFVRSPWDWYVSWYVFNARRQSNNMVFKVLAEDASVGFKRTIKRLLVLGDKTSESQFYREKIAKQLPDNIEGNKGLGIVKNEMLGLNESFYVWQVKRMLGENMRTNYTGHTDNLRQDFISILTHLNVYVSYEFKRNILLAQKRNATLRGDYHEYYDDELADLVQERSQEFLKVHPYVFSSTF